MSTSSDFLSSWNESYGRGENHVFCPSDEMVRFISRYVRRRVGLNEYEDVAPGAGGSRVLDVGCGIGRHLAFGAEMGLSVHGLDLSHTAVKVARKWLLQLGSPTPDKRVVQGDIRSLPWGDGFFDHAFSDSALDSMPYGVAQVGVAEISRVMKHQGYFYCSLVSGDESGRPPNFSGEVVIEEGHEKGTIQSFFDEDKVLDLVSPHFDPLNLYLVQHRVAGTDRHFGRWHFIGRRK